MIFAFGRNAHVHFVGHLAQDGGKEMKNEKGMDGKKTRIQGESTVREEETRLWLPIVMGRSFTLTWKLGVEVVYITCHQVIRAIHTFSGTLEERAA
jgi:hypothetical protein